MSTTTRALRAGGMVCTLALAAWMAVPAFAQDQDRDRDRDRIQTEEPDQDRDRTQDQLRDRLRTDADLTDAEVKALDPELAGYAAQNGDPAALAETVRTAKRVGCSGACLGQTVRTMTRAMESGMDAPAAGQMTQALVREQVQTRAGQSEEQLAQGLRERTNTRLREQTQEQAREKQMQRERDRGVSAGPGGPAEQGRSGGKR